AQQALRRSPEFLSEPILVQVAPQSYFLLDVHALNIAYWQIRGIETQVRYERAQAQMIQSAKMASLGRLVDGVAHEILDPVSFIWGNLSHVTAYSENLLELLAAYEKHLPDPPHEIVRLRADLEVDYLRQDFPQTIESIRSGADRLSKLATSLQNFCHIDEVYPKPANLHELLDSILLLLKSRLTSEIQVIKHYDHLPPVLCYVGQLNQVFMNILSNAVNALINQAVSQQLDLDFSQRQNSTYAVTPITKPTIEITTQIRSIPSATGEVSRWVSISIADNGPGLSPEAQKQILESFSVKKRAAKETSLALSYQIITAKHGGKLEVRSRQGALKDACTQLNGKTDTALPDTKISSTGTEFEILLPLT
ncbi:MAG: HAMP domain-containing sensor histidine kinase, partial [Kovacikia sp.]